MMTTELKLLYVILATIALCALVATCLFAAALICMRRLTLQLQQTLHRLNQVLPKCDRVLTDAQHGVDEVRAVTERARRVVQGVESVWDEARAAATAARSQWDRVTRPLASVVATLRGRGKNGQSSRRGHRR